MLKKILIVLFLAVMMISGSAIAEKSDTGIETRPDILVHEVVDEILQILKENKALYVEDKNKLYAMVDKKILPHFDFRKMAQWILGIHWRQASEAQRQNFTDEFRKLLVRTYATILLKYTDQKIIYLPYTGKADDRIVIVKTVIKRSSGRDNIPVYFTFYNRRPGWKIFDLTIENISLVTNYRKVYASRIRRQGIDGLIANLAKLNNKAVSKTASTSR